MNAKRLIIVRIAIFGHRRLRHHSRARRVRRDPAQHCFEFVASRTLPRRATRKGKRPSNLSDRNCRIGLNRQRVPGQRSGMR